MAPGNLPARMSFHEAFELSEVPTETSSSPANVITRFMSRQPAWVPGQDLGLRNPSRSEVGPGAYGGVTFAQAALAAARSVEREEENNGLGTPQNRRAIHCIQAVFTNRGLVDRPVYFDVSEITSSRSFTTRLVHARQSQEPSSNPIGPFPLSDSQALIDRTCLTGIVSFKRDTETLADVAITPAQERYRDILSTRLPDEWEPCPSNDITAVKEAFPNQGHGSFPILQMHKVDMTAFNEGKPITERRELFYYRLLKPIPTGDVNAHILCHAFEADRTGIISLSNHLGWGHDFGTVATLDYSFYVHVNAVDAELDDKKWWIQEVFWPRYSAGRGIIQSLIWSPGCKHVATSYQDGLIMPSSTRQRL